MNYFIWNKKEDYHEGLFWGVKAENSGLFLAKETSVQPGYYVSRIFDSCEAQTVWDRMVVELHTGENMAVDAVIFGTDVKEMAESLMDKLSEEDVDAAQAQSYTAPFLKMKLHNPGDVLLGSVAARYLWFSLTLWGNGYEGPSVKSVRIWFPRESWISFLPECYQTKSDFLERYLAVFETFYREMEEDIRNSARYLDIECVPQEMLSWLVRWLDMENTHLWPPDKLRRYLKEGAASYAFRGTKRGLERMVWIYTGERPFIVESRDGDYPYEFCLYICEQSVPTVKEYKALLQIMKEGMPAWMEVRLCVLRPYLFLNQDSYIGINSVLSNYQTGVLDGKTNIPFAVLGGKET